MKSLEDVILALRKCSGATRCSGCPYYEDKLLTCSKDGKMLKDAYYYLLELKELKEEKKK